MRDIIYMHFLACESARKAIRDLIEFQPNNAENTITILISELPAYRFLLRHFPEKDVRYARLKLREDRYRTVVSQVYYHTEDGHEEYKDVDIATKRFRHLSRAGLEELCRDWAKAYRMLGELKKGYVAAFNHFPPRGQ
jgi:hypothetical protein